jgi:phosphotriesterase-related protein
MHEHVLYDGTVYFKRTEGQFPEDSVVKPDDLVSLDNIGVLQRNFTLSKDACSMFDEDLMTAEMQEFKDSGGQAMVDMSAPGLRCNVPGIKNISEKTGVHVIATTGLYTEDSWPDKFKEMSLEDYYEYMMGEIKDGIEDTGILPARAMRAVSCSRSIPVLQLATMVAGL